MLPLASKTTPDPRPVFVIISTTDGWTALTTLTKPCSSALTGSGCFTTFVVRTAVAGEAHPGPVTTATLVALLATATVRRDAAM
jgi:hypothetical protein